MSEQSGGPGWWLASDGKWYPPTSQPAGAPVLPPPPPGGAPGSTPYYGQQTTNGYAIASLVLGIVSLCGIGSILALVFGYRAKREIDASQGRQTGRGLAIAGIVLGWIGVVAIALFFALAAIGSLGNSATTTFEKTGTVISGGGVNTDPIDGYCNEDRYLADPDC